MDATNQQTTGPDPTPDELLAMAYADGELSVDEAKRFEERLRSESSLVRAVAEHQAVEVLARRSAPPEPADHDWASLQLDPVFRTSQGLGWILVIVGLSVSALMAVWGMATNEGMSLLLRCTILGCLIGFVLLFLTVLWRRMRAYPLDPYRNVER